MYEAFNDSCSAFQIARQEREADAALERAARCSPRDRWAGGPFPIFDDEEDPIPDPCPGCGDPDCDFDCDGDYDDPADVPDMWDDQDRVEDN